MSRIEGLLTELVVELDASNTSRIEAFMHLNESCWWTISIQLIVNNEQVAPTNIQFVNLNYLDTADRRADGP